MMYSCRADEERKQILCSTGLYFGEFGFFGDIRGGFEVEAVAVGVGEGDVPHVVADEGFAGFDAAGFEFVVESERESWHWNQMEAPLPSSSVGMGPGLYS